MNRIDLSIFPNVPFGTATARWNGSDEVASPFFGTDVVCRHMSGGPGSEIFYLAPGDMKTLVDAG